MYMYQLVGESVVPFSTCVQESWDTDWHSSLMHYNVSLSLDESLRIYIYLTHFLAFVS